MRKYTFLDLWHITLFLTRLLHVGSGVLAFSIGSSLYPRGYLSRHTVLEAATETASICVIGGGVSGLTAALTAARESYRPDSCKIVVLEGSPTVGGRVQSDVTVDDLVLDRGFAVFIEQYPYAQKLLDYDALGLMPFLPGALIKLPDRKSLARVADPLRQPQDVFTALLSPVGSLRDKAKVLPLVLHVKTKTIAELFDEPETNTLTALTERWGFSKEFIDAFFRPFLEGIYLAPLEEQSSRMFTFVFKMFSDGAAALPKGGLGAVSKQLADRATAAGVDIRIGTTVSKLTRSNDGSGSYRIKCANGPDILSETVIVATEGITAKRLLATVDGLQGLGDEVDTVQRSVGCLYYSFQGPAPVTDAILVLNGVGVERGNDRHPVNNVCFPSVVNPSYAPIGRCLCSVTILRGAMESFTGRDDELDTAVRTQLATWFPDVSEEILTQWRLERIYRIPHAQPAQFNGPLPANENGGRLCTTYRDTTLPEGLFVCGDHVATATLNGALESGVNAGRAAATKVS